MRNAKRVATTVGYGPRFLHSTGQLHKGGPANGVFLQVTCDPSVQALIPGRPWGFDRVVAAQADGDLASLLSRGRRAMRAHLPKDVGLGLQGLAGGIHRALRA